MEIRRYLAIFKQHRALMITIVIFSMLGGWAVTPRENQYVATAIIYVGKQQLSQQDLSGDKALGTDRIVATYGAMITTEPVARNHVPVARWPCLIFAVNVSETVTPDLPTG